MKILSNGFKTIKTRGGGKTIHAWIKTKNGKFFSEPAYGTSAGKFEVKSFGKTGKIKDCKKNFPKINNKEFENLNELDNFLKKADKPPYNSIGGNLVLGIEVAFMRALAKSQDKELYQIIDLGSDNIPKQLGKVVGGGSHSSSKGPVFQEFLISTDSDNDIEINKEIHEIIGKRIRAKKLDLEGGWQTKLLEEDILNSVRNLLDDDYPKTRLGLDIAANEFFDEGMYVYADKKLNPEKQLDYVKSLIKDYDLFYVEDPFVETDFENFSKLQKKVGKKSMICGDDLTVTNLKRLDKALKKDSITASIVKPNQIGSLKDTIDYIKKLKQKNITSVVSHRSKETTDDFLTDLAIGSNLFKIGIKGKERTTKLKRLQNINIK